MASAVNLRRVLAVGLLVALAGAVWSSGASASGGYVPLDLGTLPGDSWSQPTAINANGQVVGYSSDSSGNWHAFSWTETGGMVPLGTLGGGVSSAAAINDSGQVVGQSTTSTGRSHAFLWTQGTGMVDLGTLGGLTSSAYAINAGGQVVGSAQTASGVTHAFSWTKAGGMVDLGTLPGIYNNQSIAMAVNDAGQVAGDSYSCCSPHAFSWTKAGGMVDIGSLCASNSFSYVAGLNNLGEVVGRSYNCGADPLNQADRAFAWTQTAGMVDLGAFPPGDGSSAVAVNDSGQIVGSSLDSHGDQHAFFWTPSSSGLDDLGTLGGSTSFAAAIDPAGQVVGTSYATDGWHAFSWTPGATMVDLGTLPGDQDSQGVAINANGEITGYDFGPSGPGHAVAWVPAADALTITLAGHGSGTVTTTGISCPGTCSGTYPHGTTLTLTASPDPGSTFTGWSGGGCSGTATCQLTMTAPVSIAATFVPGGTPPPAPSGVRATSADRRALVSWQESAPAGSLSGFNVREVSALGAEPSTDQPVASAGASAPSTNAAASRTAARTASRCRRPDPRVTAAGRRRPRSSSPTGLRRGSRASR